MTKSRQIWTGPLAALLMLSALQGMQAAEASGGLTLIEGSDARATALGDAFTTATNDIAAFSYNPASLNTLQSGHASFSYQEGLLDDFFGQLMVGVPLRSGAVGLSVAYYDGGDIDLTSQSGQSTSVKAQTDLFVGLGYALSLGDTSLGVTGKLLSSELVEQESAQAYAVDFGLNRELFSNVRVGAAVQNIGTQLKFVEEGDDLPRIARAGLGITVQPNGVPTNFLVDVPYHMNEQEWRPSVGVEVMFGVLSLRAGYKSEDDVEGLSLGTGFMMGRSTLDYSFGFVEDLDAQHKVSLSMRFGQDWDRGPSFVKKPAESPRRIVELPKEKEGLVRSRKKESASRFALGQVNRKGIKRMQTRRQVYKVKSGDTLGIIAQKFYGHAGLWKTIYSANKHLIDDPRLLETGQKIIIP